MSLADGISPGIRKGFPLGYGLPSMNLKPKRKIVRKEKKQSYDLGKVLMVRV